MRATPPANDTAQNPHAERPARPPVRSAGCKKMTTATTFAGRTTCCGFSAGAKPIRAIGADQNKVLMRYKIP